MKSVSILTALLAGAFALPAIAAAVPVSAAQASAKAPADAYFGPLKQSPIGLRMQIDRLEKAYRIRAKTDADLVHDLMLVQTGLADWQRHYPRDFWLPNAAFHLEQVEQLIQSDGARRAATSELHFIVKAFPGTPQAHSSALRLKQGFPPFHAETAVCIAATPLPKASAAASATPGASSAPTSGASTATLPTPAPTPTGSPTAGCNASPIPVSSAVPTAPGSAIPTVTPRASASPVPEPATPSSSNASPRAH